MSGGIARLNLDGPLKVVYGPLMVIDDVLPEMITPEQVPLPSFPNQKFCGSVQMAPGLFMEAYVPTQQELSGDFSTFGIPLLNPLHQGSTLAAGSS